MIRGFVVLMGLLIGFQAQAKDINSIVATAARNALLADGVDALAFNWKVGDTASYGLNMGGFIKGSMVMTVKDVQTSSLIITQDMDLGFAGKQNCEIDLNPQTGKYNSIVCNGQAQNIDEGEVELIDSKEDTVTVPAGTFTCLYLKILQKKDNTEAEQWANPKLVPVFGMIKTIAPSQLGKVTLELKAFKKF